MRTVLGDRMAHSKRRRRTNTDSYNRNRDPLQTLFDFGVTSNKLVSDKDLFNVRPYSYEEHKRDTLRDSLKSSFPLPDLPKNKPQQLTFDEYRRLKVCTARQKRKEVLHALKRTGKGGSGNRPPVWKPDSKIKC